MVKKIDWRKLPRKPAAEKRSAHLRIRLTPADLAAIHARAAAAGQTVTDYVVGRCAGS
jgi:uncharacterized protein (DUF1778 family)